MITTFSTKIHATFENGVLVIRIPITIEAYRAPTSVINNLTKKQTDVLRCLVEGMANKEIGKQLNIASRTVTFHVTAMLKKTGLRTRHELAKTFEQLFYGEKDSEQI